MKSFKIFVIVATTTCFIYYTLAGSTLSTHETVNIQFDQHGTSYITAGTMEASFFGLGYTHAKDRLNQMNYMRKLASGTLSETTGQKSLDSDKFFSALNLEKIAENNIKSLLPKTKKALQAYSDGVNHYIKQNEKTNEIQLWKPSDSILIQKLLAWQLQSNWQDKLKHFKQLTQKNKFPKQLRQYQIEKHINSPAIHNMKIDNTPSITDYIKNIHQIEVDNNIIMYDGKGSNAWVVNGKLSNTKKPLMATDLHLNFTIPGIFYLAQIVTPDITLIGGTIPGIPFFLAGHNNKISWGTTNADLDTQDLFILDSTDSTKHENKIISAKGLPNESVVNETTHVGPVILVDKSDFNSIVKIALAWPCLNDIDTTIESLYNINLSFSWENFKASLDKFICPTQNIFYADQSGNIGYALVGKLPIRNTTNYYLPVPHKKEYQWEKIVTLADETSSLNSEKNFFSSANNRPELRGLTYLLRAYWKTENYRIKRINNYLSSRFDKVSKNDFIVMQNDTYSTLWDEFKDNLPRIIYRYSKIQGARMLLHNWDGLTHYTSPQALIFNLWYQNMSNEIKNRNLLQSVDTKPRYITKIIKNIMNDKPELIAKVYDNTIQQLHQKYGHDYSKWQWGNEHYINIKDNSHSKNINNFPTSGDRYTINTGAFGNSDFTHIHGAVYRQIIDFSDIRNSLFMIPFDQSEHAPIQCHLEKLQQWREGQYVKINIENATPESTIRLKYHTTSRQVRNVQSLSQQESFPKCVIG